MLVKPYFIKNNKISNSLCSDYRYPKYFLAIKMKKTLGNLYRCKLSLKESSMKNLSNSSTDRIFQRSMENN